MRLSLFKQDIGIDLGTANTLVYIKGKGIVLNEASVIAYNTNTKKILAVGNEAKNMIGAAPPHIKVVRPLEDGVISDFGMTHLMLKEFVRRVVPTSSFFTSVRVVIGVPSGVTEVEKRAVEEVTRQMGAKEVYIMEEPMAAAIGSGLDVDSSTGCMITDIGGGTSDIAIIALGGIVTSTSLRIAGDKMNESIINYIRKVYSLLIGEKMAEKVKTVIGCAYIDEEDPDWVLKYTISGRDLVTGLPKSIEVNSRDICNALEEPVSQIIDGIRNTLENAPPELAADIINQGMMMAGGGAFLRGLDTLISRETGIRTIIAENAAEAVAMGTGMSLQNMETIQLHVRAKNMYTNINQNNQNY
ncbi:MAG: rod shape-determining protein [Clostridia bacterium]|nr:rod shape-determining protein [Clostridia bacterium]